MMMPTPPNLSRARRAFALVLVLIIVSVLALVTVGFLSSMSQERATANAFANKTRAEQSAQAGVDTAMGILRDYFKAFPDSATVWDTTQDQYVADASQSTDFSHSNEGTTLYLRAVSADPANPATDTPQAAPGSVTDPTTSTYADYIGGNGPNNLDPTTGVDNRHIFVLPLVSGATVMRLENKANSIRGADDTTAAGGNVKALTSTNSVNVNARRTMADTSGWLGTTPGYTVPSGAARPKPFNIPWVEIRQRDGVATGGTGPVIGRYAFWVEDESFRANVSYAGLGDTSDPSKIHFRRDNAQNLTLNPKDADLQGTMTSAGLSTANATTYAQNLFDLRATYPGAIFPESRAFAHTPGLSGDNIDALRYLTTSQSSGLNLTRHGTQRLNLNGLIPPTTLPNDTGTIQKQIDVIVKTLQFHLPNYGQRFYRIAPGSVATVPGGTALASPILSGSVTDPKVLNQMAVTHNANSTSPYDNYAKIYYYKEAANIRDYIDNDCFPTCILNTGLVRPPGAPAIPFGDDGDNAVWALGKDAAPFINECAAVYQNKGTVIGGTTFDVTMDYYIEVWNMSTKDVKGTDLGPNPFIRVSQPTKWQVDNSKGYTTTGPSPVTYSTFSTGADVISDDPDGISPSSSRPTSTARDFKIDVSGAVFPAGQVTVVTTDAAWSSAIKDPTAATHIVLCPWVANQGKSEYKGHYPPGRSTAGKDVLNMVFDSNPAYGSSSSDYETDITFGSDWGYIDCLQGALPLSWSGRISIPYTGTSLNYPYFFGGAMIGNFYNLSTHTTDFYLGVTGDPRSTNEQLQYWLNPPSAGNPGGDPTAGADQSKFTPYGVFNAGTYGVLNSSTLTPVPGNPNYGFIHTFGQPNYRTVRPNRPENPWADFPPYYSSPNGTPTTTELSLNPALAPNPVANGALTSIGQLGDVYDASRTVDLGHLVNTRGGGRSLKIGQHDDRWDGDQASASRSWTAWRLTDVFSTVDAMQQPGLININGVFRDNGAALRAALTGFKFQPVPPSAGQTTTSPAGDLALYNASNNNSATAPAVDELIAELKKRLVPDASTASTGIWQTGTGPFWERGELSELPGFGRSPDVTRSSTTPPSAVPTTYAQNALVGTDMSSLVFDRGREELFRRLVEMTTTRGNIFTVYALGQAVSNGDTKHPVSTHRMKVTFRVVPKNSATDTAGPNFFPSAEYKADYSNFVPATALPNRFKKPDHYEIEVLSVSSSSD